MTVDAVKTRVQLHCVVEKKAVLSLMKFVMHEFSVISRVRSVAPQCVVNVVFADQELTKAATWCAVVMAAASVANVSVMLSVLRTLSSDTPETGANVTTTRVTTTTDICAEVYHPPPLRLADAPGRHLTPSYALKEVHKIELI